MTLKVTGQVKVAGGQLAVNLNTAPTWTTAAGTIGTQNELTAVNFQFEATDAQQGTSNLTFTLISGSLPAGLSLNSSTGLLSGTASDVGSDTTSNFSLRVTDTPGLSADRAFSMTISDVPPGEELWSWGSSANNGYLGQGDNINRSSPVQIGVLTDWTSTNSDSGHIHVIKSNGSLWGWGRNNNGRLGDGTIINKSSPVQIGALTDWANVVDIQHSLAVKTDGTLWAWGLNSTGQLGLGDSANRSSPVQIGILTDWASVAIGSAHSHAVKTNGTLWSWGNPTSGRLGNGTSSGNKSSPVQIGILTDWASISCVEQHTLAIKTNGELWAWGFANSGRLGDGQSTANRSSPVQIGALTDWSSIGVGNLHSLALKTDGSLWVWGDGAFGKMGTGDIGDYNSPVQVGALTNWTSVDGAGDTSGALKTDGTIWTWGAGESGKLGLGNTTNYSSPSQVGSLTTWTGIRVAPNHTIASKTVT